MQQNTQQQKDDALEIDFGRILQIILQTAKRFWLVIVLIVAVFTAAAVFVQRIGYTPRYKAYCTFSVHVVHKATMSDTHSIYAVYYDQDLADQLDATFSYLINSDFLTDDIREYLGEDSLGGSISVDSIEGSNIFMMTAYSSTPEKAGALLDALLAVYYDAARFVVGDMKTELIEEPIVSETPYNKPNWKTGALIGAEIGVLFCLCALAVYAFLKRTVMNPSDLEKHLNMPCFGVIPLLQTNRALKDNPATVSTTVEQGTFRESIRGIARKLDHAMNKNGAKVILVTSTAPGEGKSVVSQNLAESFAHWGKKVILVDGDLRKPSLYRRFGFKKEQMPLEAVLSGNADIQTVLRKRNHNLFLVLNSVPVEKPTVVADSSEMKEMITSFAAQADVVIIDTPPCGQLSDAALYQQYADGIVYVVQQDRMTVRQIVDAAENLYDSENKLLGYVLNGARQTAQGYGKYGYGHYSYGSYGSYGKYGYNKYGYGKYSYGKYGNYGKYGYGKYGYGKYGYSKHESPGESDQRDNISER